VFPKTDIRIRSIHSEPIIARRHFNIILPCASRFKFTDQNNAFLIYPIHFTYLTLSSFFDFTTVWLMLPISVAARAKAWTVFARSNTGIVGSNPTQGMDACVRLLCVCVVLCIGSGLATGWSPVQGVLPTVYGIKKLKKRPSPTKGL
jgi:hypothetical protein